MSISQQIQHFSLGMCTNAVLGITFYQKVLEHTRDEQKTPALFVIFMVTAMPAKGYI